MNNKNLSQSGARAAAYLLSQGWDDKAGVDALRLSKANKELGCQDGYESPILIEELEYAVLFLERCIEEILDKEEEE